MTWPLVILRVNRSTYEDIQRRVAAAGQHDRMFQGKYISLDEVAIEVDPNEPPVASDQPDTGNPKARTKKK